MKGDKSKIAEIETVEVKECLFFQKIVEQSFLAQIYTLVDIYY